MRHRSLQFRSILAVLAATAFVATFFGLAYKNTPTTDAAVKATDFKAGRIIDDEVFYDPNTMTVDEIQAHLDKYSANCDMWGSNKIGYGRYINGRAVDPNITRREYARLMREAGRTDYHDAPYVCISKYYENPTTHKTNFDTNAQPEEGMISAAQIIYNAAHEYNINPQVLLVMLKKESYVWGDTWPLKNEYNTVMGYACPDNAPCDSTYFGFHNQVMKAAWQLKYYKDHIYSYGYYPYMTNNIYYSPNYSCGTKAVYLENIATTSLYIYTPYTPNDAALANYPGEAYCGSYGNRNFFMYFSEWFGSTYRDDSGKTEINKRYNELGGEQGVLGKETTGFICGIKTAKDCVKGYENGAIIYSSENGAFENYGKIREKYLELKSVGGTLGFPTTAMNCNIGREGACVQGFENGTIIYSVEHGAFENYGEIRKKYLELKSVGGWLGFPIESPEETEDTVSQKFENGLIINKSNSTIGYEQHIYDKFISLEDKSTATADAICGIKGAQDCVQAFNFGAIIYSTKNGAYVNSGSIRDEYQKQKSVGGELGFPTTDIECNNNNLCVQKFENGAIYNAKATSSFSVIGGIYNRYSVIGEAESTLGLPTENKKCNIKGPNDCVQAFEKGTILYSPDTGAWENSSNIRVRYLTLRSVGGVLGFPTGSVNKSAYVETVIYQAFQNGVIYYDTATGRTWELLF